jgi:hypothetical protein
MDEEELTNNPSTGTSTSPITYNSYGTPEGGTTSSSGGGRGFFGGIGNAIGNFVSSLAGESPSESLQGGRGPRVGNTSTAAHADNPNVSSFTGMPQGTVRGFGGQSVLGQGVTDYGPFDSHTITTTGTHVINDHDSLMTQRKEGAAIQNGNTNYIKDDTKTTTSTSVIPSVLDQIRTGKFTSMSDWARNGGVTHVTPGGHFPYTTYQLPNTTSTVSSSPSGNRFMNVPRPAPTAQTSVSNPLAGYAFTSKQFPTAAQQREHQGR